MATQTALPSRTPLVEVEHLRHFYGSAAKGAPVIDDVTLTLYENEIVGLLGLNGAGKTTIMRMLTTFLSPTRGTARVAGFDVMTQSMEVRNSNFAAFIRFGRFHLTSKSSSEGTWTSSSSRIGGS